MAPVHGLAPDKANMARKLIASWMGKSDSKMICKGALVGRSGGYNMEEKLHEKEKRLLEFIRQLGHGELLIKVADGLPQMIERATEKVKL